MLIRRVVGNVIEQHFQAAAMRVGQERIEIIEGAEDRIDVGVVADVVAEIRHRRWIDRRNPDGVQAEPLQIVELDPDAGKIAHAAASYTSTDCDKVPFDPTVKLVSDAPGADLPLTEAVDRAVQVADRFQRQYLQGALGQVIVPAGGQLNVGQLQVNVAAVRETEAS